MVVQRIIRLLIVLVMVHAMNLMELAIVTTIFMVMHVKLQNAQTIVRELWVEDIVTAKGKYTYSTYLIYDCGQTLKFLRNNYKVKEEEFFL